MSDSSQGKFEAMCLGTLRLTVALRLCQYSLHQHNEETHRVFASSSRSDLERVGIAVLPVIDRPQTMISERN